MLHIHAYDDDGDGDGDVRDDDGDDDESVEKLVSPSYFGPTCAFVCNQLHCHHTRIIIKIISLPPETRKLS